MDSPCETCLVTSCCSKPCKDYAKHVYKTKEYRAAGAYVKKHIEDLSYEDALEHILEVEAVVFYMKNKWWRSSAV